MESGDDSSIAAANGYDADDVDESGQPRDGAQSEHTDDAKLGWNGSVTAWYGAINISAQHGYESVLGQLGPLKREYSPDSIDSANSTDPRTAKTQSAKFLESASELVDAWSSAKHGPRTNVPRRSGAWTKFQLAAGPIDSTP